MGIVVDSSVVLAWLMPDEKSDLADVALDRLVSEKLDLHAPALLNYEVINVLACAALRRGRISEDQMLYLLDRYERLDVSFDSPLVFPRKAVLELTLEHGLSVYDASYLELSLRFKLPFATLDEKLASAAAAEGVELMC